MHTIQTHKGELIVVPTPIDAKDFKVVTSIAYAFLSWGSLGASLELGSPEYEYSIIGTCTKGELDFDCEPYVERNPDALHYESGAIYRDYESEKYDYVPSDSFKSLLLSQKVEYANTKLVFLKREK